jgi:hypothetical protein
MLKIGVKRFGCINLLDSEYDADIPVHAQKYL